MGKGGVNIKNTVQMQNLRGRHPLKSDHNGVIIAKNNVNSYSVKVHGSGLVTVRNRASLRKILPVVPVHNLVFAQGKNPVQEAQGAESTGSRLDRAGQQAGPKAFVDRAGLRAGVESGPNVDRAGRQAGAGAGPRVKAGRNVEQPETGPGADADRAEAVLRAGAELANPGLLGVLRAMPRLQAGIPDSGLGTGQSTVRADPGHSRVLGLPEGGSAAGRSRDSIS